MALRRTLRVASVLVALGATACVSQPGASTQAAKTGATTLSDGSPAISVNEDGAQPRTATYSCADGGTMTIENLGSSIRVRGPDGAVEEELPASPANQSSRFGAEHDAIVIDGREALIMKGGRTPITCKR
jgi:hypothetical protein